MTAKPPAKVHSIGARSKKIKKLREKKLQKKLRKQIKKKKRRRQKKRDKLVLKREEDVLLEFELQQFIDNLSSDDAAESSDQNEDLSPEK